MTEEKKQWLIKELVKASNAALSLSGSIDMLIDDIKTGDWEEAHYDLCDALNELTTADIRWLGDEIPEHEQETEDARETENDGKEEA